MVRQRVLGEESRRERSAARPETAAAAMTGKIGEGVAHTPDAAVRPFRDNKRLLGTQDLTRSVDGYGSRAGDANQQHVNLGIDVLCHTVARGEHEHVDIEVFALMRPGRSRSD